MAIRLDKFLATLNPNYSRNKISSFIKSGCVTVNGKKIIEPSLLIKDTDKVILDVKPNYDFVSRAAFKLIKGLDYFKINLKGKICLDIGCSTGGFSQVMLQKHAKYIYAVDVGSKQFSQQLLKDNENRIKLREQTNFCHMQKNQFTDKIGFIACDVSFISSKKILERIKYLFDYHLDIILLIKPQFELTKEILDQCKGSVPTKYHQQAISSVCSYAKSLGFRVSEVIESPILGAKGYNKEFIVLLGK